MSLRIDNNEWIGSSLIIGETGLGVLGSTISSTGDDGPSVLYNDVTLPDDNNKEIRLLLLSLPSAGTLYIYENGSFSFIDAPDGQYTFTYQLYVDGVATGSPATVTLNVGGWSTSADSISTVTANITTSIKLGSDALSVSTTSASLSNAIGLSAVAITQASVSADLSTGKLLNSVAQSVSSCFASLTTQPSGNGTSANVKMTLEYMGMDYKITLM